MRTSFHVPAFSKEQLVIKDIMLKVFVLFSPCLKFFTGKLGCGSPSIHFSGLIAEDEVSLLAAALRIQVGLTQLFKNWGVWSFE